MTGPNTNDRCMGQLRQDPMTHYGRQDTTMPHRRINRYNRHRATIECPTPSKQLLRSIRFVRLGKLCRHLPNLPETGWIARFKGTYLPEGT